MYVFKNIYACLSVDWYIYIIQVLLAVLKMRLFRKSNRIYALSSLTERYTTHSIDTLTWTSPLYLNNKSSISRFFVGNNLQLTVPHCNFSIMLKCSGVGERSCRYNLLWLSAVIRTYLCITEFSWKTVW